MFENRKRMFENRKRMFENRKRMFENRKRMFEKRKMIAIMLMTCNGKKMFHVPCYVESN